MTEKRVYGWRNDPRLTRIVHRRLPVRGYDLPVCVLACRPHEMRSLSYMPIYTDEVKMTTCGELLSTDPEQVTCPLCEQQGHGRKLPDIP